MLDWLLEHNIGQILFTLAVVAAICNIYANLIRIATRLTRYVKTQAILGKNHRQLVEDTADLVRRVRALEDENAEYHGTAHKG